MFTKCPECNIAFRVTAKVLQQAGGNVRCGGCNHAFNALNYLSEEMPEPGADSAGITSHDDLAETSRRLLQTLDELAGSEDVRIEDTGVEWRVLEKGDAGTSASSIDDSDEMRYDDSTLLPDDFGLDRDQNHPPPEPTRRTADLEEPLPTDSNDLQGELLLSEPEDWTDLLDEVIDPDTEIESLEVEEELAAIHNQLSARDEPDATASGPADLGAQFDTQAEAMGLGILSAEDALTDEVPLLNEADIEQLVDSGDRAAGEEDLDEGVEDEDTALSGDFVVDHEDESDEEDSGEFQVDEGEEEHLEEETDDELNLADAPDEVEEGGAEEDWESTGEFQSQIDEAARALLAEDEDEAEVVADDDEDYQLAEDEDASDADEEDIEDIEDIEELALEDESEQDEVSAEIEHYVPPPTEEEMTVNMEIDQEMMALATKDNEFSATLFGVENPEDLFNENAEDVETIVMEGEFIRGSIERERLAAENAAKGQFDDPGSLVDTYALRRGKVRGGRRRYDPAGYGILIAVVVLSLALIGQLIHNSRESLATMGLFNQTIAPVYRMLGSPVTPSWDIKGWQFEATTGNVDDEETVLTVMSRIVNRSDVPLPYPLVHVSLTDRWEDIMGSRILEPGEYLAGDLDPSSPVLPGENFTAVITIENPSAEATGFKLNVCYRVSPGTVRCAIEDFKN
jgi:predicted Zn finger-like uncharacterized protein